MLCSKNTHTIQIIHWHHLVYLVSAILLTSPKLVNNYTVSQKNPPIFFWHFPKRLGIFSPNFTRLLYIHVYAGLQIFIQLSATLTK